MKSVGELDGQSELICFNEKWMLCTRANCAEHGHRQLQVCVGYTLETLSDFRWVCPAGLPVGADIYLGHVYRTDGDTLVAIVPIAQKSKNGQATMGGIYIAESRCGLYLGPPVLLKSPDVYLRRTEDMPVP